jgi:serine phosphatase RsbU (regulator of sigma subunit)
LLSDLGLQREQELAKARATQIGMLPQGALRTADAAICYSFHPFHEVGGDFLDFFTLTDGAIGIYLGDVMGKSFRRHYTQRQLWGPCAWFKRPARHRGDGGASAAVGARKSGAGSSRHPARNVPRNQLQLERGDSVISLSDGFCLAQNSEGEFFGMDSVLEVCENSGENSPEEALQQLTEAAASYSCGRPQQDDRTAAILRYIGK